MKALQDLVNWWGCFAVVALVFCGLKAAQENRKPAPKFRAYLLQWIGVTCGVASLFGIFTADAWGVLFGSSGANLLSALWSMLFPVCLCICLLKNLRSKA